MIKILIATSAVPKDANGFNLICANLRLAAEETGMTIPQGIFWTSGRGCSNLAFALDGADEVERERFATQVSMALMPSKWTTTDDPLPAVDTFDLAGKEN